MDHNNQLSQLEDGTVVWLNEETGMYEIVNIQDPLEYASSSSHVNNFNVDNIASTSKTSTPPCQLKMQWNEIETICFINICINYQSDLKNIKIQKKGTFLKISEAMKNYGHNFTSEQCSNRLKSLTSKYKAVTDHNNKSGNNRQEWKYYNLMAEYMGERPNVSPVVSCSTISLKNEKMKRERNEEKEMNKDNSKRRKISSPRGNMLQWLKEYEKRSEEQEQRRLELAEKHHKENLNVLKLLVANIKSNENRSNNN